MIGPKLQKTCSLEPRGVVTWSLYVPLPIFSLETDVLTGGSTHLVFWRKLERGSIHNITIHNLIKGGEEGKWWSREVVTKGSGEEGKWWWRGVVTKGSGEEGKWWRREVVTKGSDEEGKWWWRGVVTKGSGEEGKWWWRGVVTKGSGEEGKWWRREVVTKGSDEEGKWWWRGVVTKGSGEEGKWWRREVVTKGICDEGKWWRREVVRIGMAAWLLHGLCFGEEAGARNLVFFRVKWLRATMKGTSCVRRLRFGSFRVQSVPPICVLQECFFMCA